MGFSKIPGEHQSVYYGLSEGSRWVRGIPETFHMHLLGIVGAFLEGFLNDIMGFTGILGYFRESHEHLEGLRGVPRDFK